MGVIQREAQQLSRRCQNRRKLRRCRLQYRLTGNMRGDNTDSPYPVRHAAGNFSQRTICIDQVGQRKQGYQIRVVLCRPDRHRASCFIRGWLANTGRSCGRV